MTTPQELLDDCRQLLHAVPHEARRRTIISRAYYAACHFLLDHSCTREYVRDKDIGMHLDLHKFLTASADRRVQHAAGILSGLYSHRISADYKLRVLLVRGVEKQCVEDAAYIIEEIFA